MHHFDAEVGKLLQLVIHSLYENKDIFLRELISNASDACDKLRYEAITDNTLLKGDRELKIQIRSNPDKGTLTITDNGIGMSEEELIKNLGTIARSGTQAYLEKLGKQSKGDVNLIGQFGVGFYSAFMVADKVRVTSRRAGEEQGHVWESDGKQSYTVEKDKENHPRGTTVELFLREDEKEYADKHQITHIVKTYSDHVAFPIEYVGEDNKAEVLNRASALWMRPKSDITEEQYNEFYRHVAHAGDTPWLTLHNKAEGTVEYTNLLFVPSKRPFDLFHPDRMCRVKLYVKRVFITDEQVQVIPAYMRFLRGVIDSEDLPLNISRETLQNNAIVQKIRSAVSNRVLSELKKKAKDDPEAFKTFWENFGPVMKEGLCDQLENRDALLDVCRFQTSLSDGKLVSLEEYIARMKPDQEFIFYALGDNNEALMQSPQIEGFIKRGIEVVLLTDTVDDFWVNVLNEFKGKTLRSVSRAGVDLDKQAGIKPEIKKEKAEKDEVKAEHEKLIAFFKETLGENVQDVRISGKLEGSPVCLVVPEWAMDIRMEQFLVENNQVPKRTAKVLEINPKHAIIQSIDKQLANPSDKLKDTVLLLFAQANILEGEPITDVTGFSRRMNALLERALNG
ncbi:MAG: molecular chaperone HtpG [Proteobacteria bacterium]|nr:molecular chaperone HtpG [Pseudomonadota bacterium]